MKKPEFTVGQVRVGLLIIYVSCMIGLTLIVVDFMRGLG